MFKFKLNKSKANKLARQYIERSLKKRLLSENVINKWVTGESNFDKQEYIDLWEKYRKDYGDKILQEVLKTMAISNAVVDVNHILQYKMGMSGSQIETTPIFSNLDKSFNVTIASIIIGSTDWDQKTKDEALNRIVSKEFPLKSDRAKVPVPVNVGTTQTPNSQTPMPPLPRPFRKPMPIRGE